MVKRIALLTLAALAVAGWLMRRDFRTTSLTNTELTKFLFPPRGPRQLREGCSDVHLAITTAEKDPRFTSQARVRGGLSLSADEIAVYRAVLGDAIRRGWKHLNISASTGPLSERDFEACDCFDGIDLENLPAAFHTSHDLIDIVLPTKGMRLVDPRRQSSVVYANDPGQNIGDRKSVKDAVNAAFSTGLFSMSEIAFDQEHRHAVVSYSFWCGMLCGNGATFIFERIGDQWRRSNRDCGSWIS